MQVIRKEDEGCGTKLEIYPWAIIINTLSYPVILNISNTIFTIDCYEIFAPPRIEVVELFKRDHTFYYKYF